MFSLWRIFIFNDLFSELQATKIDQIKEKAEVLMQIAQLDGSVWDEFEGQPITVKNPLSFSLGAARSIFCKML